MLLDILGSDDCFQLGVKLHTYFYLYAMLFLLFLVLFFTAFKGEGKASARWGLAADRQGCLNPQLLVLMSKWQWSMKNPRQFRKILFIQRDQWITPSRLMALCMCTAWFLCSLFSQKSVFFGFFVAYKYKMKFLLNYLFVYSENVCFSKQ